MGPTKGMSVIAWRATRLNSGEVRQHQRRQHARPPADEAGGHQVDAVEGQQRHQQKGTRSAHSGAERQRQLPEGAPAPPMPATCIDRLISQNVSTGFDQKNSAVERRARPVQADEVVALGHLAGDLAVVGLPGIEQPVAAGERQVEQHARTAAPPSVIWRSEDRRESNPSDERDDMAGRPEGDSISAAQPLQARTPPPPARRRPPAPAARSATAAAASSWPGSMPGWWRRRKSTWAAT